MSKLNVLDGTRIFLTPIPFAAFTSLTVSMPDKCPVFKTIFFFAIKFNMFSVSLVGPFRGI